MFREGKIRDVSRGTSGKVFACGCTPVYLGASQIRNTVLLFLVFVVIHALHTVLLP